MNQHPHFESKTQTRFPPTRRINPSMKSIDLEVDAIFANTHREYQIVLTQRLSPNAFWLLHVLLNLPSGFVPTKEKLLIHFDGSHGKQKLKMGTLSRMLEELRTLNILKYVPRFEKGRLGMVGRDWQITPPGQYSILVGH